MLKKKADMWYLLATKPSLFDEIQTSNRWCVCICVVSGEDQFTPNIHVYVNMYTVTLH